MKHCAALLFFTLFTLFSNHIVWAEKTFIISGNSYAPPIVWEERNSLSGVAPDLIGQIFDELSIPYRIRIIDNWEQVQREARDGKIDLIVSAFRNKEREAYLNFSIPYLPEPSVVVVKKGREFEFASWGALKGKKGVAGIGESFGQEFDAFIKSSLDVSYFQLERAIQELSLGKADYLIIDYYTALIYTYLLHGEQAVTIVEPSIGTENFHFAIPKESELNDHLEDINRVLSEKISAGVVTKLFMKYYDRWQSILKQQSEFFSKLAQEQSAENQQYMKQRREFARQSIIKLMADREELPSAAH